MDRDTRHSRCSRTRRAIRVATSSISDSISVCVVLCAAVLLGSAVLPVNAARMNGLNDLDSPAPTPARSNDQARGQIDLRPRWESGKADRYSLSIDANARLEPGAGLDPMNTRDLREIEFRLVCISADGAGADVAMVIDRFSGSGTLADGSEWKYDSADSSKNAGQPGLSATLGNIAGSVIRLRFDSSGQIESVSGGQGLLAALPGVGTGEPGQAFGSLIGVNPGKSAARVGDRWTTTSSLDAGPLGRLELTTDSVLRSATAGIAQIEVAGRVSQSTQDSTPQLAGIELGNCTHRGKYRFDYEAGRIRDYTTEMDMRASISFGGTTAHRNWAATVRCRHLGPGSTIIPNPDAP